MTFYIITIFPDYFSSPLKEGVIARAISSKIIRVIPINLRNFTKDKHKTTDDRPYGGGAGMVMIPEPLSKAIEFAKKDANGGFVINLTPRGHVFNHEMAQMLSEKDNIIIICGRYEGIDQRIVDKYVDLEVSIGDFVLTGGEPAALVLIDATSRLIPGVLGCNESAKDESFSKGLLEYPHYSRPRDFKGMNVPEVLLSGDHKKIEGWRRKKSLEITLKRRPELLKKAQLSQDDLKFLKTLGYDPKETS